MKIVLFLVFLFCFGFSFSQKKYRFNDPFHLTGEINNYEFITRNKVDSYTVNGKNKQEVYSQKVKFNNWYFIESVIEKTQFKKTDNYDSIIKKEYFYYDNNSILLSKKVNITKRYFKKKFDVEVDTVFYTYKNQMLSSKKTYYYTRKIDSEKRINQWDYIHFEAIDSIVYGSDNKVISYLNIDGNLINSTLEIYKTELDSSKFIDDILMQNQSQNFYFYNDQNKITKIKRENEECIYIYNNLGQLVLIVKQDLQRNLVTDFQYRNLPSLNPQIDYYIYDNNNYLLEKIITNDYYFWNVKIKDRMIYNFEYKFKKN